MEQERQQVAELARQFAEAELRPNVERWDREGAIDPEALDQLRELGFFGMLVPERYGGFEFGLSTYLAALEELARAEPSVALTLSIHSAFAVNLLVRHGTERQREEWLPRLASGEILAAFALSESDAGSDAAAVRTTARREGGEWVLSGRKRWVTNGRIADVALVLALTDGGGNPTGEAAGHGAGQGGAEGRGAGSPAAVDSGDSNANGGERRSHGLFLVPTSAAGYSVEEREKTMGMRTVEVVTVRLDEVRLTPDQLIGEPGRGFAYAMEGLDTGRLGIAAQAVGIAAAALDFATAYADQREQFGQAIREFEGIQFKLADMATGVAAARALLHEVARAPSTRGSSMAKLLASETASAVTREAVQIFGGYGYMRDYPVEKLMRDAKATEIYEGTSEIQRVVIARELYRDD